MQMSFIANSGTRLLVCIVPVYINENALNCHSFNYVVKGKGYQTLIINDKITV